MSKEGIGKNKTAEMFAKLWGSHHFIATRESHVTGNFNAHLRNCSVLVLNEAVWGGDRSQAGPLKGLITDDFLPIVAKGVDVVHARNCSTSSSSLTMIGSSRQTSGPGGSRFFVAARNA
jgi:hypothetical protein